MKRIVIAVLAICLLSISIEAIGERRATIGPKRVPAYPGPIERVQPNGDTIIVRLYGDERRHYMTTEDNYLVVEDKRGFICYARERKDGRRVATCRVAHNKDKRSDHETKYLNKKGIRKL